MSLANKYIYIGSGLYSATSAKIQHGNWSQTWRESCGNGQIIGQVRTITDSITLVYDVNAWLSHSCECLLPWLQLQFGRFWKPLLLFVVWLWYQHLPGCVSCWLCVISCHLLIPGWQPRWFVLDDGVLVYYKSQEEVNQGCKGSLKITACEISGERQCFMCIIVEETNFCSNLLQWVKQILFVSMLLFLGNSTSTLGLPHHKKGSSGW